MRRASGVRQRGLALITVLLIFAIVSMLAVAMIDRQSTDVQRSGTMLALQQARSYVFGAEQAVKTGLYLDWKNDKEIDHLNEEWAQERTFPLSPGLARISIADAMGRFNLNSLSVAASNKATQKIRFTNLLNMLGLDIALADTLSRWMDETSQDDDRYQSMEPPYKAAYQGCKHSSELLLLEGMDMVSFRKLEPYVACLPITAQLNVNTASAMVLASLDAGLSLADGEAIFSARGDKGFKTVDDFWSLSQIEPFTRNNDNNGNTNTPVSDAPVTKARWDKTDFSVKSEYFEIFIRVELGDRIATGEALIKRDNNDGRMTTLYRDYSRREAKREPESTQPGMTQ
ncbi:type II secretion system minor pseudopilin GspK [Thalassolituus pacificus]|uniref:Type II secretion system protein K n=1 Tax=Thalassolituus pacificus TaxID=2975440 RepID=A0A9X3AT57_9GAMM|nr:type II secretion system minor pseudopilin GspK [Thalassolituus pacificus]MCT7359733.1 type II secretion system minor pseudopilin GspK [Thalassolituus pacificus]